MADGSTHQIASNPPSSGVDHDPPVPSHHSLPNEVLSAIFEALIESHSAPGPRDVHYSKPHARTTAPFKVARVCRRWREVAVSTSRLWTYLRFHGGIFGRLNPRALCRRLTKVIAERSGRRPLSIIIDSLDEEHDGDDEVVQAVGYAIKLITPLISRTQELRWGLSIDLEDYYYDEEEDHMGNLFRSSWTPEFVESPFLVRLSIDNAESAREATVPLDWKLPVAPLLQRLHIAGVSFPMISHSPSPSHLTFMHISLTFMSASEFSSFVGFHPQLETLELEYVDWEERAEAFSHPKLSKLYVKGPCLGDGFHSFDLPNLSVISIEEDYEVQDTIMDLSTGSQLIQNLAVTWLGPTPDNVQSMITGLSPLINLTTFAFQWGRRAHISRLPKLPTFLQHFLPRLDNPEMPWLCPNLRTLWVWYPYYGDTDGVPVDDPVEVSDMVDAITRARGGFNLPPSNIPAAAQTLDIQVAHPSGPNSNEWRSLADNESPLEGGD